MRLTRLGLRNTGEWEQAGVTLPRFDIDAVKAKTDTEPRWIHFGAGNIFRAFPAAVWQHLLESGNADTGIIAVGGNDPEVIRAMRDSDNLTLLVTLKGDGSLEKSVIASVTHSLMPDEDFEELKAVFICPSLQMVSFTITEKGYVVDAGRDDVALDYRNGPQRPLSYMGTVAALCYERYKTCGAPLALVSMDNCSKNGDRLREAVMSFADAWGDAGFIDYIKTKLSFPWSMIDKITPRPDDSVARMLAESGIEDMQGKVTAKHTYIAPFVNAEETQWLVIEDAFPNGRPPLEKGGIIFTDRETVEKVEKMKVCTCLNPLHTALAIFGCLLGYTKISDEMKDADLIRLAETVGYTEGLPVVVDPVIINPKAFIDNVVAERLPNPFMPDTPQRIVCDTSQKLPIRFGETLKAYMRSKTLEVGSLRALPLVYAGWLRYLQGVDDEGNAFELSPDPLLHELTKAAPSELIRNAAYFGADLYEAGIADRVLSLLDAMQELGGVRKALRGL